MPLLHSLRVPATACVLAAGAAGAPVLGAQTPPTPSAECTALCLAERFRLRPGSRVAVWTDTGGGRHGRLLAVDSVANALVLRPVGPEPRLDVPAARLTALATPHRYTREGLGYGALAGVGLGAGAVVVGFLYDLVRLFAWQVDGGPITGRRSFFVAAFAGGIAVGAASGTAIGASRWDYQVRWRPAAAPP